MCHHVALGIPTPDQAINTVITGLKGDAATFLSGGVEVERRRVMERRPNHFPQQASNFF